MMGALVLFFPMIANNSALYYQLILGTFLGIDIAITLKNTNALPEGQFKLLKVGKYVSAFIANAILFVLAAVIDNGIEVDMTPSVTVFSAGCFIVIAMFLGALEGNKLLTYGSPDPKTKIENPPVAIE
jgi:hypothetical protein